MKCPYCAEDIKEEAIVCAHCRRDLTFFKPLDKRLEAIESQLAALTEVISKIAAHLDGKPAEGNENSEAAPVAKLKKPTWWRLLLVVLLQYLLTFVLLVFVFGFLYLVFLDWRSWADGPPPDLSAWVLAVTFLVAAPFFVSPILVGLWMGLRWRATNFKRYLLAGLLCGAVDGAAIILTLSHEDHSPGMFSYAALFILMDLFRYFFGFATGGLLGDWIEKRRYPQLYGKGFTDLLALKLSTRRDSMGRLGRLTGRFESLASPLKPLAASMALIATLVGGIYTFQDRAKKIWLENKPSREKSEGPRPADNTPPPSPQPSVPK